IKRPVGIVRTCSGRHKELNGSRTAKISALLQHSVLFGKRACVLRAEMQFLSQIFIQIHLPCNPVKTGSYHGSVLLGITQRGKEIQPLSPAGSREIKLLKLGIFICNYIFPIMVWPSGLIPFNPLVAK